MKYYSHTVIKVTIFLLITMVVPFQVHAIDYYVDQNHPNASDSNAGTTDKPWKTINKANQTLVAGDTVYIKAGTYTTYIAPVNSGTAASPITYRNYDTDAVTITDAQYGIYLSGNSYILVQGIDFYNLDNFLWIQNSANHNTVAYCNFDKGRNIGWHGSRIYKSSSHNWVHHCRFSKYGYYTTDDIGSVLDVGDEESQTDNTKYNLIENNTMYHGGHHVLGVFGMYNVIRNNYFHNEAWSGGYGNRVLYLSGYPVNSGWNLIENNRIGYSAIPPDNWGSPGLALSTSYNIIRRNKFLYNDQSAIALTVTSSYYSDVMHNKIYNNTFLHNGWNMTTGKDVRTSALGFSVYSGNLIIKYNSIKNNVYYDHYQTYGTYNVNLNDQIFATNWDGDTQGDPIFVNASKIPGDPMDPYLPNVDLQAESPCIDSGTFLTRITSGSGTGKSFKVEDSSYFMDGWGNADMEGDEIQIFGSTKRARIVSIDYSTNTITVDRDLEWVQDQGISLAYEGTAPDIGAYELKNEIIPPGPPRNLRIEETIQQ